MIRFLTSLTFLYALIITLLIAYGLMYYKSFIRSGFQRRRFPWIFLSAGLACLGFLYFNFHAPLSLRTISNLDHHFIKHEGFRVAGQVELGRADTVNFNGRYYNDFILEKKNGSLRVASSYADEPFYTSTGNQFKIASVNFPATGHQVSFQCDSLQVSIVCVTDSSFELHINNLRIIANGKFIRKASTAWMILKDEISFINSPEYNRDKLVAALKNIFLLRDQVSREKTGELKYFLSGRLFSCATNIQYDNQSRTRADMAFRAVLPDNSQFAWGIGFLDNNRNQFRVQYLGADSFALLNKFPVSYPLTEENKDDWTVHTVNKFLLADSKDLLNMPDIFTEGFLFSAFSGDSTMNFSPVLLNYQKDRAGRSLKLMARYLPGSAASTNTVNDQLLLPAVSGAFSWVFSIQNSFNWKFGTTQINAAGWQRWIFGTLAFFIILVFAGSWLKPAHRLSWIWQLLSVVTLVLLTTRFFLYWRYKSFPPYEGLDLPSLQQLNSFWNFGVIIITGLIMSFVFGYSVVRFLWIQFRKRLSLLLHRSYHPPTIEKELLSEEQFSQRLQSIPLLKKRRVRIFFFSAWIMVLLAGGMVAAASHFDPNTCRHLAIGLMILYFVFTFISYKYSPLVTAAEKSWWGISTGKTADILISNPVKLLLSVSLLSLFAFVDIGFAIVFLNFLLFNEAFLCINYAFAGLSAGSNRNARLFGFAGMLYTGLFILNLLSGPYIFSFLLGLPTMLYAGAYAVFAVFMAYLVTRLMHRVRTRKKRIAALLTAVGLFISAYFFFPKERILDKAALTKYRIDVMTMPVDKAIETAYEEGKTYEPVIRAAQNQWFINTFIYEKNNPSVNSAGFHLLPHSPQNKGARYNAQATDLVTSRFFIAEHGKWSVLLYVLLLLLPASLLASFYKLYPDFTNRINGNYPAITVGFSLLNYLLITALLVILAATGRYIFFGQDLPFGSILSKQSILFPSLILLAAVFLFKHIPLEHYPNRKKIIPGSIVFGGLAFLLILVKPVYNRDKEFRVDDLAKDIDTYIQLRLQPVMDYFDTARYSHRFSRGKKDRLFSDSVSAMIVAGMMRDAGKFFLREMENYTRSGFSKHLDQSRLLYLDLNAGRPQLAVNDNYFRVEPPPHLQQYWTGNVLGDTTHFNLTAWQSSNGRFSKLRLTNDDTGTVYRLNNELQFLFLPDKNNQRNRGLLVNNSASVKNISYRGGTVTFGPHDSIEITNPGRWVIRDSAAGECILTASPDAFMKNYFVNGSRFYVYPMGSDFIWTRNFAESVSPGYAAKGLSGQDAFISLDALLMDSLHARISAMMHADTAYKSMAEYGVCIADGNGRLIALSDFIRDLNRPDPNDKAGFNKMLQGENGVVSQSLLRKEIGNINLLRLNPGPGSTLKPIVFSAIASQLKLDWDAFSAEGFSAKQQFYGGEKVSEYDFEKNNGRISRVSDYIRYSDNYYHSNLLLLGSYPKQPVQHLLSTYFTSSNPDGKMHWPYFGYNGKQYWLNGFQNWPGYRNGETHFGTDSSFISVGLVKNFGICTWNSGRGFDRFCTSYDSLLFRDGGKNSGFLMPEFALFDQQGNGIDHHKPNEVFMACFRGHVKGSSQVMIPPVKMLDAFGKLVSQNRNYTLTLNPWAESAPFSAFSLDPSISYNDYLSIVRENIFEGMKQALFSGTAARLGAMLKNGTPYYYYAKTGTTGDDEKNAKSKLFAIVISKKDIADPGYNFRKNKFFTVYFTSQNGPAKQNETFQLQVIRLVEASSVFRKYMESGD